ncbi:hypothetical protein ACFO5R_01475 [Halosolutus amylolyticus]|uniref:Uncharacterized protein n=1 Tax=Halosolutus amylolyticus TaxID=2932267 RepID=A0ABD5PJM1_9EURY|nr:hypothetical protein [Halosolutus amylolyticus]
MEWTDHVDQLLLDGERERERIELESAIVVVTTHRVLAFTPGRDGADFRVVDRPNVRNVTVDDDGSRRTAGWTLASGILGIGLLVTSTVVDPGRIVGDVDGDGPVSGVVETAFQVAETVLTGVELALFGGGLLLLALSLLFGLRYGHSRSRRLVLRIAGDDDLDLPVTDADLEAGAVPALEAAIGPESTESGPVDGPNEGGGTPDPDRDGGIDRRDGATR